MCRFWGFNTDIRTYTICLVAAKKVLCLIFTSKFDLQLGNPPLFETLQNQLNCVLGYSLTWIYPTVRPESAAPGPPCRRFWAAPVPPWACFERCWVNMPKLTPGSILNLSNHSPTHSFQIECLGFDPYQFLYFGWFSCDVPLYCHILSDVVKTNWKIVFH